VQHITLALWLLGIGVVSLARLSQSYAFRRARPEGATIGRWRNSFLVGALASGVLWGAAGVLFFPEQSFPHQVFTSFVVAGMIAGSVATLSPVLPAFILFALPAMAPIAVQFLLRGGEIYFSMSVMAMLYGLAMVAIAKHVNATLRTSLGLSQRNSQLIAVLVESTARTETLNRSLETEAAEHRQKEVALRQSETMLAEAQKMAHLGSWTYDPHTRQTVWSAEAFRIYGTDEGSAIPSCRELIARIHREDRSRVQRSMLRAAQHGEPYETEFRILTPAQGVRWIHALCSPSRPATGAAQDCAAPCWTSPNARASSCSWKASGGCWKPSRRALLCQRFSICSAAWWRSCPAGPCAQCTCTIRTAATWSWQRHPALCPSFATP
jgi:PAS domain-containing protein